MHLLDDETLLTADGFDSAIIGTATPWQANHKPVAVYDVEKCIQILMDGMDCDYEEAAEYFEYNVTGAYVGEQSPIYVYRN